MQAHQFQVPPRWNEWTLDFGTLLPLMQSPSCTDVPDCTRVAKRKRKAKKKKPPIIHAHSCGTLAILLSKRKYTESHAREECKLRSISGSSLVRSLTACFTPTGRRGILGRGLQGGC